MRTTRHFLELLFTFAALMAGVLAVFHLPELGDWLASGNGIYGAPLAFFAAAGFATFMARGL